MRSGTCADSNVHGCSPIHSPHLFTRYTPNTTIAKDNRCSRTKIQNLRRGTSCRFDPNTCLCADREAWSIESIASTDTGATSVESARLICGTIQRTRHARGQRPQLLSCEPAKEALATERRSFRALYFHTWGQNFRSLLTRACAKAESLLSHRQRHGF